MTRPSSGGPGSGGSRGSARRPVRRSDRTVRTEEPDDAVEPEDALEPEDGLADQRDDDVDDLDEGRNGARGRRPGGSRLDMLYRGNGGLDIIGRTKTWYLLFGALVVICLLSMLTRGFNLSVEFSGGSTIQFPARGANGVADTSQVTEVFQRTVGRAPETVQRVGAGTNEAIVIRSERLDQGQVVPLRQALFERFQPFGQDNVTPSPTAVTDSAVSASWGNEITDQAIIALIVFLVLVAAYLAFYFQWRMAVAAIVALANDIIVTAGVYSLVGFEVAPATIIGLLTILGFSLYDTVVVFDKVRENTRGLLNHSRRSYAEAANLAVNQTLMRSLNTSLIAALPLIGLFVVGVVLLGVGVLGDLALVQLVGTIIGAASSILLATPIVVDLTMRDRRWAAQARKVAARRAKGAESATRSPRGGAGADGEATDVIDTRAVAAAGGRPSSRQRGVDSTADSRNAPVPGDAPRPGARPAGKSGRPAGKRRH